MIEIDPGPIRNCRIRLPGSKSHTHRALIAAALASGESVIVNPLKSEDTELTARALKQMGVEIAGDPGNDWRLFGCGGRFLPRSDAIYLGNSGTSMRLLTALAALGEGPYLLTGTKRMQQRPIGKLIDGLRQVGASTKSVHGNDCPPVVINGKSLFGGRIKLDCSDSSQYLSALLLIGPLVPRGLRIDVTKGPVSQPYIDLTLRVMESFGIVVSRREYTFFNIEGGQSYRAATEIIEPDASNASYFWAAAAITGVSITVNNIGRNSFQGDVKFTKLLAKMGCRIDHFKDGIGVTGGKLKGITVDMGHMPDVVPTLAVVAAFAEGPTRIENVGHLRIKESDRLFAVATELRKMGIGVDTEDTAITIHGGKPKAAIIDTYDDHRMAMSFAVAGLVVPGVYIRDEACVGKSFPSFWKVFDTLYS